MKQRIITLMLALVTLGTAKLSAQEAYAVLNSSEGTLTFYYDSNRSSHTGLTFDMNAGEIQPDWYTYRSDVTTVIFDSSFAEARPTSTFNWFCNMINLTSVTGIQYLNTSEVLNMYSMFSGCKKLTSLDLSGFNTAKVTSIRCMFQNCLALTSVGDLSGWNTSNVTDMATAFYDCIALTELNVSGWNTSNVIDMSNMFNLCTHLSIVNLGSWNTANVTNMTQMFRNCYALTTVYVGSGWNTNHVNASVDMFKNCDKLKGGNGTPYDANFIDKTYAQIDGGTSHPGYFTEAPAEP